MHVTKCVLAVFSPTGGTEKAAKAICEGIGLQTRTVDLCKDTEPCTLAADQVLVAAAPVYGGRIPTPARERLEKLRGAGGPAVAIVVYGNRAYDDALFELKDVLTGSGFTVTAAGAFIAEHSIVRDIAAGRPDAEDEKAALDFGAKVMEKLQGTEAPAAVDVPGSAAYHDKKVSTGAAPKADKKCVSCGACAAACPVGAIPPDKPNTTTDACIGCMRCISVCPQKARDIPGATKLAVGAFLKATASKPKSAETFL